MTALNNYENKGFDVPQREEVSKTGFPFFKEEGIFKIR